MNTNTNLGKTKEEIIYGLLLSLNAGNCQYYCASRIDVAIEQYESLVERGIVKEL